MFMFHYVCMFLVCFLWLFPHLFVYSIPACLLLSYFIIFRCFLTLMKERKKGYGVSEWGSGKDLGGVGGAESIIEPIL